MTAAAPSSPAATAPTVSIAVIGAGIAGLSCAQALQAAGHRVTVFEKSRGPAGRMSTRRGEGWQCDHGAPSFQVRGEDFRAVVAGWVAAGLAAPVPAEGQPVAGPPSSFVGTPTMTAPARALAGGLNLLASHTVQALLPVPGGGWRLQIAEAGIAEAGITNAGITNAGIANAGIADAAFDHVLLAIPSPQAAALLQAPAPAHAAEAAGEAQQPAWVMMLQTAGDAGWQAPATLPPGSPLALVMHDRAKPGRSGADSWALHATRAWSEAHLEDAAPDVQATLLAAWDALGAPPAVAATVHRWRYAQVAAPHADGGRWWPGLGLGRCGDAFAGGGVEGAWRSGVWLAEQVRRAHGG